MILKDKVTNGKVIIKQTHLNKTLENVNFLDEVRYDIPNLTDDNYNLAYDWKLHVKGMF